MDNSTRFGRNPLGRAGGDRYALIPRQHRNATRPPIYHFIHRRCHWGLGLSIRPRPEAASTPRHSTPRYSAKQEDRTFSRFIASAIFPQIPHATLSDS